MQGSISKENSVKSEDDAVNKAKKLHHALTKRYFTRNEVQDGIEEKTNVVIKN